MTKTKHFILLFKIQLFLVFVASGQTDSVYNYLKNQNFNTSYPLNVVIGMNLIGKPYFKNALNRSTTESVYCSLNGFDCVTFIESTLALSEDFSTQKKYENFKYILIRWRYKNSQISYSNRIHYFSDWIEYHESQGRLKNITQELGGVELKKKLSYLSDNKHKIKQLNDDKTLKDIQDSEKKLNESKRFYIPKLQISSIEGKIQNGDIICLTSTKKGIDIDHVGYAVLKNGRVHFLHASHHLKRVTLTKEPFLNYINRHKHHTGIVILRLKK